MHQITGDTQRTIAQQTCEVRAQQMATRSAEHQGVIVAASLGSMASALVIVLALLTGCGNSGKGSVRTANAHVVLESPSSTRLASNDIPHLYGPATGAEAEQRIRQSLGAPESVPPDVVVSALDTVVTPGQAIAVAVEGTSDVTEMALSDGHGDALPMVRDSTGSVWRVNYRVPLRPRQERLPLSVTAKNEHQRWRRVWLFLRVDSGKQDLESETEQSSPDEPR